MDDSELKENIMSKLSDFREVVTGGLADWQIILPPNMGDPSTFQVIENNGRYAIDSQTGLSVLLLKEDPVINDSFYFTDNAKSFNDNPLYIIQAEISDENIQGLDEMLIVSVKGATGEIVFVGGDIGWMLVI